MIIYVIYKTLNHRDRDVEIVAAHTDYDEAVLLAHQMERDPSNNPEGRGIQYWFHVSNTELSGLPQ